MTTTVEPPTKQNAGLQTSTDARAFLIHSLLTQGAIPFVPQGRSGPAPRPVPVRGEPVSETISAERH